jgi:hypothetical protein
VIVPGSIRLGWRAWTSSLGVLARSPEYVIALAAILAVWGLAGYQWLWLPESSPWVLALTLVWLLAMAVLAVAVLAGSALSVSTVAAGTDARLRLRRILSFEKKGIQRAALVAFIGLLLGLGFDALFGWINNHALNAASFLTFQTQHPVSYVLIGKALWVIEALIWIVVAGFLTMWLLAPLRPTSQAVARSTVRSVARGFGAIVFLTGVLAVAVFGGLASWATTWHPRVKAGNWDYAQLGIRTGGALLLITLGWLFWMLALARLLESVRAQAASTPPT